MVVRFVFDCFPPVFKADEETVVALSTFSAAVLVGSLSQAEGDSLPHLVPGAGATDTGDFKPALLPEFGELTGVPTGVPALASPLFLLLAARSRPNDSFTKEKNRVCELL